VLRDLGGRAGEDKERPDARLPVGLATSGDPVGVKGPTAPPPGGIRWQVRETLAQGPKAARPFQLSPAGYGERSRRVLGRC
jgi:hypothetical protein